jgi:hypothetical protein
MSALYNRLRRILQEGRARARGEAQEVEDAAAAVARARDEALQRLRDLQTENESLRSQVSLPFRSWKKSCTARPR